MFKKILVPIDLDHRNAMSRALVAAAELASSNSAPVVYLGVYGTATSAADYHPSDYEAGLNAFSEDQAREYDIETSAIAILGRDPKVDLCPVIISKVKETGADVIVMASHTPGWIEHVFHSNAGYVACHSPVSVFVVR